MRHALAAIVAVAVALSVLSGAVGVTGLSAVTAERNIQADVAPQETAFLGVETTVTATNGTAAVDVTTDNNMPGERELLVVVTVDGDRRETILPSSTPGARDEHEFEFGGVPCGATVQVHATGLENDVSVETTLVVDC